MARKSSGGGKSRRRPRATSCSGWKRTSSCSRSKRRPTLAQVEHALAEADPRLQLENLAADDDGLFASLLVESPEDHAAVEVSYETGEAVIEQNLEWAKQLQKQLSPKQLQQLWRPTRGWTSPTSSACKPAPAASAEAGDSDGPTTSADADADDDFRRATTTTSTKKPRMEIFDPTCLLTVVEALSHAHQGPGLRPRRGRSRVRLSAKAEWLNAECDASSDSASRRRLYSVVRHSTFRIPHSHSMLAKDLKPGGIVKHNDAPLIIESVTVQSPSARGGTTLYKFRARNLVTKQKIDLACKGTDNFQDADFEKRAVSLMYADQEHVHLLDQQDYNQYACRWPTWPTRCRTSPRGSKGCSP